MDGSEQHSDDCVERGREESFSEQVSPVSNPKQVHKREGVQQHLFIEIPANDTAQDVGHLLLSRHDHSGKGA